MNPFGDGASAWIFHCSWDGVDTVTQKQLLEFVTCKFTAVVMDDGDRYRVTAKPFGVNEFGVIRGSEACCGYLFEPCSCSVYYGTCLDLFVRICSVLERRSCTFQGPTMSVWTVAQGDIWFNVVTSSFP